MKKKINYSEGRELEADNPINLDVIIDQINEIVDENTYAQNDNYGVGWRNVYEQLCNNDYFSAEVNIDEDVFYTDNHEY